MEYIHFKQYHINADHIREFKTVEDLIQDPRFIHQESGKEREALCKDLFYQVNGKPKTPKDGLKQSPKADK